MPRILVYNPDTNRMEAYYRGLLEPMPYVTNRTMTVGEFRGSSQSNVIWTDKRIMTTWNVFRRNWGRPIFVGYAFKRIWQGGHSSQSQHYAGTALDMGHTMSAAGRDALRAYAVRSGLWTYVEPASLTPRWVHVDDRFGVPACTRGGFPTLRQGSKGVYVCTLQDALNAIGYRTGGIDGDFGPATRSAVIRFQTREGLGATGVVNCATWQRLTTRAIGIGRTATVIDY